MVCHQNLTKLLHLQQHDIDKDISRQQRRAKLSYLDSSNVEEGSNILLNLPPTVMAGEESTNVYIYT